MFLTVTFNPALDKTLFVPRNDPQDTLRATRVVDIAGGKGINVSRALRALGAPSRALAPLGGHPGAHLAELARAEGLEIVGVPVSGQTRTALTIQDARSGHCWHYLEPGPELTPAEREAVLREYESALFGCIGVTLSGSLPCESAAPLVPEMVRIAAKRGIRVALDSFGSLLRPALEAGPWLAKPNDHEWLTT